MLMDTITCTYMSPAASPAISRVTGAQPSFRLACYITCDSRTTSRPHMRYPSEQQSTVHIISRYFSSTELFIHA